MLTMRPAWAARMDGEASAEGPPGQNAPGALRGHRNWPGWGTGPGVRPDRGRGGFGIWMKIKHQLVTFRAGHELIVAVGSEGFILL
jgi:hypothetical protein